MDSDYGYCIKVYDMIRRTGLQDPSQQWDAKFINQIFIYVMFAHSSQLEGIMFKKILHSTFKNSVNAHFGDQLTINKGDLSKRLIVLRVILGLGSNTFEHMNFLIEDRLVTDSLDVENGFNIFWPRT